MKRFLRPCLLALVLLLTGSGAVLHARSLELQLPALALDGVSFTMEVMVRDATGAVDTTAHGSLRFEGLTIGDAGKATARLRAGRFQTKAAQRTESGRVTVTWTEGGLADSRPLRSIPGVLSILPPLLAIVLALLLRQVIVSLFVGVWLGAVFVFDYDPFGGFLRVLDHYIIDALADPDHMSIIAFSMLFGGMVGVISKSGGTLGIASQLTRIARSARGGQLATWLLGFVIFFDDYANSLIVGNTMRPITDRLRISREKLAFLVDATAAPVTAVLFISTWIGYEVGLIDAAMKSVDLQAHNAYAVFLDMLPYSFYPILTLVFGLLIAATGRDFGSMARAEHRAHSSGQLYRDGAQLATDLTDSAAVLPDAGVRPRWWNAAVPIVVVVLGALGGLYYTGHEAIAAAGGDDFSLGSVIGAANSYKAMLWASLLSCVTAIVLAVGQRILRVSEAMDAWFNGLKSMLLAMLILTLAWSIGQITAELHTADYLVQVLKGSLPPQWLPALTFLVAAVISFSTGTSWGTMGIIMPIVIPLSVVLGQDAGLAADPAYGVTLGTIASVLSGAVFGDHCSPISDTTILSSMASACDHIDHVRTQLPYALLVGVVSISVGLIPSAFGLSPWISIVLGAALLGAALRAFGRTTGAPRHV
ncbi:MAG: Na+/H+ antiporter NhaC family protein [Bacteroidota bacterium]|nr:Na+/H+ antiporter NhaC family protein [Bacteroidota bacterium]